MEEILHHQKDGWNPKIMGCLPPFSTGAGFRNHQYLKIIDYQSHYLVSYRYYPKLIIDLIIQGGAPKIAKLVYNSNNYGLCDISN